MHRERNDLGKGAVNDETSAAGPADAEGRHLSRRTVLRAAGHAAWVVPTIQVLSVSPAFAASGPVSASFTIACAPGAWRLGGSSYIAPTITVTNTSTTSSTLALQLVLTFPNVYVWQPTGRGSNRKLTISRVTGSWRAGRVTYSGTGLGRTAVVVFTATAQVGPAGSSALGFRATTNYRVSAVTAAGQSDVVAVLGTATGFTAPGTAFDPTA